MRGGPARRGALFLLLNAAVFVLSGPFILFYGPFPAIKALAVGAILTSRHPQAAEMFLSAEQARAAVAAYGGGSVVVEPVLKERESVFLDQANGLRIESVSGRSFRGRVLLVADPLSVRVVMPSPPGQTLTGLTAEYGAAAGIGGGGYALAPDGSLQADGLVIADGRILRDTVGEAGAELIGLDAAGTMVLAHMTAAEALERGVRQAVSFTPFLIRDGQALITGDGGWGLAPRAGIGQRADGTVILVVLDGRQPGWSMGATLRDLMNVFVEYGAVQAANLDGGSSAEMVYGAQVVNRLWNVLGERRLPTAWLVAAAVD
ncbi:MAG: phosphodiester glycosidase family protein [Gracilibacteraceae bacterium]|jgi:exopolysaccharide biosynthesis protein|nr:phosphodiester glycosidase family protein [Gracilibacteraceae bacterium]